MLNLANEIRPKTLDEIVGQKDAVLLLKKVAKLKLGTSFIFFGEAGTGKSSAAFALANDMGYEYGYFNATTDSKADLVAMLRSKQILIIDEIHRLNKDKQDILLSYLEFDKIIVYATTTENPYFRVNPAIRSRMQIVKFLKLNEEEITDQLEKIVAKRFPDLKVKREHLLTMSRFSAGDFRSAINNLQMVALFTEKEQEVTHELLKIVIPNINFYSDMKDGEHYNNLSAFHKSLRGSDVDAALYYGALILKTGDYQGLIRRMNCVAYEDIGMANIPIITRMEAVFNTVERLGFPEANLAIGFGIVDLALSPKSNSTYIAFKKALNTVEEGKIYRIPSHLRDSHYKSAPKLGDGVGYKYPHDFPDHWVNQTYLPKELQDIRFYESQNSDYERKLQTYWDKIKNFNKK
ncbi:replication-associated recombination protein A [Mycoplasma sp. Ms02]|uniref:replication-associated recombination protein A n=1 Tax=Mycoplasma sp. Ms02 TaxID=353851 RepID=UPI001C8B094F|nr:replication-associated recombination protein A [Mycoplasma sp. Ms02]QZE12380.1 replication-associated recombination protein A [Mycoplasma sp. Ms02]